jgi:uncharacterized protein YjbI with pentapeptide repeats
MMYRSNLLSSAGSIRGIRRIHLVAQRADVKRAGVKRTDLKRAEVKRTDVKRMDAQLADAQLADAQLADAQLADAQLADAQLADVKGMGLNGATEEGTHVIVPNYYPRPLGRGPLTLATLLRDGYFL